MFSSNTSADTAANYIEDVFSTYLWAGNSSSQSINIGFNLTTSTAMTWFKDRTNIDGAGIVNTVTGLRNVSYATDAASNPSSYFQFTSTGYNLPTATINTTGSNYVGWTWKKQPKFFDVLTYTGTGSNRTIAHSLGSVPGCIMVKRTDTTGAWQVYHRSLANTQYMVLNTTAAVATGATRWNSTTPTSIEFSLGTDATVNASGGTYVAYLFAHDAGGFGLTGTDNVISCGSFTTDGGGNATVSLGYEPQWVMVKNSQAAGYPWYMADTMRGMSVANNTLQLLANSSAAETSMGAVTFPPNATGFNANLLATSNTYIYIAIRRGPMKVPTTGTSVFTPLTYTGSSGNQTLTSGFTPDLFMADNRAAIRGNFEDRLRGLTPYLQSTSTGAEATDANAIVSYNMTGVTVGVNNLNNKDLTAFVGYFYRRAPGFFDEVCYTGTGAVINQSHNLAVPPELVIFKSRSAATAWRVIANIGTSAYDRLQLNATTAAASDGYGSAKELVSQPTLTTLSIGTGSTLINSNGATFVAYLFATCPGVSKVGTYTGTGTTQTINCGFTAGARFVLIKRTDSTGDWYVWDSARGIVAGNDPRLSLNSTAAEVTTDDSVDTDSTGFVVNQLAATNINVSSATYIFMAMA
jgi:hypothetical protein